MAQSKLNFQKEKPEHFSKKNPILVIFLHSIDVEIIILDLIILCQFKFL